MANTAAPHAASKKGGNFEKAYEAAMKTADDLGKQAGKGDLAVSQAFTNVVKFADQDIFSPGTDDSAKYATRLSAARAAAGFTDSGEKTIKKNASYFEQAAKAAKLPAIDFNKVCQNVYTTFADMKAKGKPSRPLLEAYIGSARAQLAQPTKELSAAQITECCQPFVKAEKQKHRVEFWMRTQAAIEKAMEKFKDQDDETIDAFEAVQARIAAFTTEEIEEYEQLSGKKKAKQAKQKKQGNKPKANGPIGGEAASVTSTVTQPSNLETTVPPNGTAPKPLKETTPAELAEKMLKKVGPGGTVQVGVMSPLGPPSKKPTAQLSVPTLEDTTNVIGLIDNKELVRALKAIGVKF